MRISDWSSDVCSSDLSAGIASRPKSQSAADPGAAALLDFCARPHGRVGGASPDQRRGQHCDAAYRAYRCADPAHLQSTGRLYRHDARAAAFLHPAPLWRDKSEEHTSELQSLMRISYAVFCLKKKNNKNTQ